MKKIKLSTVVAPVLSLGAACSGFACASSSGQVTPRLPQEPVTTTLVRQNARLFSEDEIEKLKSSFEESKKMPLIVEMFLSKNGQILDLLLGELEGVELFEDFPKSVEEFACLLFSENSQEFVESLHLELETLIKENKNHEATVMLRILLIAEGVVSKRA